MSTDASGSQRDLDPAESHAPSLPLAPLVAQVLHDLRGPLNTIGGWAAILERPALGADLAARASEAIRRATRMQARLLDEIGLLGTLVDAPCTPPEPVLLAELLDAVVVALDDVAGPRNIRVLAVVPRQVRVMVSVPAARSLFWWAGHAAAKVAPAGGTLEFAAGLLAGSRVEVTIAADPPGPRRRLVAEDPLSTLAIHLAGRAGVRLAFAQDEGSTLARVGLDSPQA